jgi:aryl-alcohol dehydrogenase-like predicted oxidoreductase/enamine deaminase RidA (YjgF/YER057c/UK114 family)
MLRRAADRTMTTLVERRELQSGFSISRVVTGLWQIADMERGGRTLDLEQAAAAMAPYVENGFTSFDMADHYGSAEVIAGLFRERHAGGRRAQLFTKWVPKPGPLTRQNVSDAVQQSLQRLRAEVIDLLQFHAWNFAHPSWLDALFWLQDLKRQGLIRHIGLTNFDTAHLRIALHSGVEVTSNQVSYSLVDQRARHRLADLCLAHNVTLLAYGTLAGGFLSERWLGAQEPDWERLETWSQMKYGRFIRAAGDWAAFQHLLRTLEVVARRHAVSLANVACRHVLDQPGVGAIIVGARLGLAEHIQDNLRLFGFSLDPRDRDEIGAAQSALAAIPGDSGDEYRRPPYLTASGDLSHHVDESPAPYSVRPGPDGRRLALSGTPWEGIAGYARAVRSGNRIWISGTTATHGDRLIGGPDAAAQTHFVIDKIEGALQTLGGRLADVVRTRVFVRNLSDWEPVARAHGERFHEILPANTLVQAGLVGDEYLVEMEAEALVPT